MADSDFKFCPKCGAPSLIKGEEYTGDLSLPNWIEYNCKVCGFSLPVAV